MTTDRTTRIVVIDDHQVSAESVARILDREPGFTVVGAASRGREGVALVGKEIPDVAVIDVSLPDTDGVRLTHSILEASPHTQVLVLTSATDDSVLLDVVEAGCMGFVTKNRARNELVTAVRLTAGGDVYIPPELLSSLLPQLRHKPQRGVGSDLSTRELEILELMHQGASTTAIARQAFVSVHTVRNHVHHILTKLGAHSKREAVEIARDAGLFNTVRPSRR